MKGLKRRDFLKTSTIAGIAAAAAPNILLSQNALKNKLKIGFIGVGLRGTGHLTNMLARQDITVPAVCDTDPERISIVQKILADAGQPKATTYSAHKTVYKDLLDKEELDGVVISTPWVWHFPMAIDAMKSGIPPAIEVCGAFSVQECWDLVRAHEESGVALMFLENVCYRRDVMAILNMVRQDMFGEILHCHCGYQHDLREVKFEPGVEFGDKGRHEAVWRTRHSVQRNGDLYPTHGIGPVANYININRGNRFVSLVSSATKSRGLHNYIVEKGGENHPNARIQFALGDIVTTLINCANGETVMISHDTNLPRPYSLAFRVQGTRGLWMKDGDQIYLEGVSPKTHEWEPAQPYLDKYDHPLWKRYSSEAAGAGHGGMDFYVRNAYVESLKRGEAPPLDVYDAAAWSVITPLSEQSIAEGGSAKPFPDFTRGHWITRKPVFALGDAY
jgi:predicted dehydrogenase